MASGNPTNAQHGILSVRKTGSALNGGGLCLSSIVIFKYASNLELPSPWRATAMEKPSAMTGFELDLEHSHSLRLIMAS